MNQHIRKKVDTRLREIDTLRSHAHHITWLDTINSMARTACLMRWEEIKFKCVCQVKPFKITQAQDVAIKRY